MVNESFQDAMGADNVCWGCGPSNPHGLQIKSYWDGDESICRFRTKEWQIAGPGLVNGGILSSVIDCHCICTAAASLYRAENRPIGSEPKIWCVTASLEVTFLRPTPTDAELVARARITEQTERKMTLQCSVFANGAECVRGRVVAARWVPKAATVQQRVAGGAAAPAG